MAFDRPRQVIPAVVLALAATAAVRSGSDGITDLELAGVALPGYPHFEYVRSFDPDTKVRAAIDPSRFPEITGATCDIYLVASRTAAAWEADSALIDVTFDGFHTASLQGATIQQNTFLAATPHAFESPLTEDIFAMNRIQFTLLFATLPNVSVSEPER